MKMLVKYVSLFFNLCILALDCTAQGTGYVTLKQRQFYDGSGNKFYPVMVNYLTSYAYDPTETCNDFYLSHEAHYGAVLDMECNNTLYPASCTNVFVNDLYKIKNMGFNCVRYTELFPDYDPVVGEFYMRGHENRTPIWGNSQKCFLTYPYTASDPVLQKVFALADLAIQLADAAGLKVMLHCADADNPPNAPFSLAANSQVVTKYAELLAMFADYYKTNTTIMAYDVYSETLYADLTFNHTKLEICTITDQWWNAIKNADGNHLICYGGSSFDEVFEWDPAVIKMDFWAYHYYNDYRDYEGTTPGAIHNLTAALERQKTAAYWHANNCPYPWMIGETGFAADATISSTQLDGDYSQQENFVEQTLNYARNYNGSGYTYWQYQEVFWTQPAGGREDMFGLLKHGNANDPAIYPSLEKPAINKIRNYLDVNGQPPAPVAQGQPANYYDPMQTAAYTQFGTTYNVTGTVVDHNNVPIKDAVLRAHTWMETKMDPSSGFIYPVDNVFYTFSTANTTQNFALTPFNPKDPSNNTLQYIRWLSVTSIGSSNAEDGHWWDYPNCGTCPNQFHQVQNNQTFQLTKIDLNLNASVENQIVNSSNSPITFQAWHTLTVTTNNTVQAGGIANFKALDEVNVQGEFHAQYGSEVHIYNEAVFSDCNDISGFRVADNSSATSTFTNSVTENKSIELVFKKKNLPESVSVFPNPNTGIFTVNYIGDSDVKQINIYDIIGNTVIRGNFSGNIAELNLTAQPKGVYFLEIKSNKNVFNQKIVIQ